MVEIIQSVAEDERPVNEWMNYAVTDWSYVAMWNQSNPGEQLNHE